MLLLAVKTRVKFVNSDWSVVVIFDPSIVNKISAGLLWSIGHEYRFICDRAGYDPSYTLFILYSVVVVVKCL